MNGRVAAVLGVGPGLGAAVARRFAVEGFAVAMMARREESLAQIRQDIEGATFPHPDKPCSYHQRGRSLFDKAGALRGYGLFVFSNGIPIDI
jgi:NAD(P)-dependent dehydrogenase (short-subunit alcohol dehydrogenase family)